VNLIGASLIKLLWRPAAMRTLLLLGGLVLITYVLMGAMVLQEPDATMRAQLQKSLVFPGALATMSGLVVVFAGIAGAAFGGIVAGSEWSWNTYRVALTRGESRVRYVIGLFVALALVVLAAWLVLYVFGIALIVVAALLTGTSSGNPFDPSVLGLHIALILTGWWAILLQLVLAFAVSFISRSMVAGVAAVMALIMAELVAVAFIPMNVLQWAPFSAGNSLVKTAGQSGFDPALAMPLTATTAYVLLALLAAAVVARRSEVA
jgi:ABC-type transport system involved in multi-copper enzyme maturation permease subunit